MIGSIAGLIWEYVTGSISLWLMVIFLIIPITMILSVVAVLLQRMKEIEGGESDAAADY